MDITTLATNPVVVPASTDTNFHVLGEDVFRLEFCYQLRDGTYSSQPVLYTQPPTWSVGTTFFHGAMMAPSSSNGDPTYEIGSPLVRQQGRARLHLHERKGWSFVQSGRLAGHWLAGLSLRWWSLWRSWTRIAAPW